MFDTTFSYKSATAIPANVSIYEALKVLHDFETINKLNPDVRGSKPIVLKTTPKPVNIPASKPPDSGDTPVGNVQYFEVEDDLPFIPKRLWSGGVRYQADFLPTKQGCDITVHAPGGFTSINHWRLILDESKRPATEEEVIDLSSELETAKDIAHIKSKDLMHTESIVGGAWFVQIISDAKCNMTFASFVKGFLKNSHSQLQQAFIDKCVEMRDAPPSTPRSRRPTLGRRKSSVF